MFMKTSIQWIVLCWPTEELCTLVITEAFPEDSGLFKCVAINPFGTVSCSAILEVYNGDISVYLLTICTWTQPVDGQTSFERPLMSLVFCTLPCRPGGAVGGRGHLSAGNSFSQTGRGDGVSAGDVLLQKEHRGQPAPSTARLYVPPPSRVAGMPSRR